MKHASIFAILLLIAGCAQKQGKTYLNELSNAIHDSDRIIVTEHSFELDAYDMDKNVSLLPETVVYRTLELNQEQKNMFLSAIKQLDPKTQDAFPACIFEPHHTVYFHVKGKLRSTMQICFGCGQVEWSATQATPPWSLYGGLQSVIKNLGLQPERDWPILAQEHLKQMSNKPLQPIKPKDGASAER